MTDLLQIAKDGYGYHVKSPYLWSSDADAAYRVGMWLYETHRTGCRFFKKSRGYTYRANEMIVRIDWDANPPHIERIS